MSRLKPSLFWLLLGAAAFFLHLKNLGETALWQDEAETAVLGRNTAAFGVPKVFDGKNLMTQNAGADHDERLLMNYIPWLSFYLTAASFLLLGESTFTARLPFALLGIVNLLWVFRLARRWSGKESVARLAAALSLLSVPQLLFARQCRYYALAVFFVLYLLDAYDGFLESRRRGGLHIAAALTGLFYSSYVYFYLAAGALALHYAFFGPRRLAWLKPRLPWLAASGLMLLPGILFFRPLQRVAGETVALWPERLQALRQLALDADAYLLPLALVPALWLLPRERLRRLRGPIVFLVAGLALQALSPRYFFRYLLPLLPIGSVLWAAALAGLAQKRRAWAAGLAALALGTNLLTVSFWLGGKKLLRTDLADYLGELTAPFPEPIKAAAAYLNAHAHPADLLLVTYPDIPFMFYTPLRVVGGNSGPQRIAASEVKWIVLRDESEKGAFPVDYSRYERIELDAPNLPWGNRPDPDFHFYRPPRTAAPAAIYRLIGRAMPPTPGRSGGRLP